MSDDDSNNRDVPSVIHEPTPTYKNQVDSMTVSGLSASGITITAAAGTAQDASNGSSSNNRTPLQSLKDSGSTPTFKMQSHDIDSMQQQGEEEIPIADAIAVRASFQHQDPAHLAAITEEHTTEPPTHSASSALADSHAAAAKKEVIQVQQRRNKLLCCIAILLTLVIIVGIVVGTICGLGMCTASSSSSGDSQQSVSTASPNPPPSAAPPSPPTPTPTPPAVLKAFQSNEELLQAVDDYLLDEKNPNSEVALTYGHPIGTWNVRSVTSFRAVFDSKRNPLTKTFNEDLDGWDVSNALSMFRMFGKAERFNGNITNWKVGNVETTRSMVCSFAALESNHSFRCLALNANSSFAAFGLALIHNSSTKLTISIRM